MKGVATKFGREENSMEIQWPLILFTSLLAWSAGLFGAASYASMKGYARQVQNQALVVSAVLLVVGGIAVFFHLQHWERIFNGFGHITSGITQELIAIVVFAVVMVIYFVYQRKSEKGSLPKWVSILALVVSALLVLVMGCSYLMNSRPAWSTLLEVATLFGAALLLGPATLSVISRESNDDAFLVRLCFIGSLVNVVCVVAYVAFMALAISSISSVGYYFDPTTPTKKVLETWVSPFASSSVGLTIAVFVAAVAAVGVSYFTQKKGWSIALKIVLLCVAVICTVCLRVLFYQMGVLIYPFF
jgi:anaerobic dimethyl sulfoxide reductase subunit C (anchor subunit)